MKNSINDVYVNFWGKPELQFTNMEIAIMEGGHSIEEPTKPQFDFIKSLIVSPASSNKY